MVVFDKALFTEIATLAQANIRRKYNNDTGNSSDTDTSTGDVMSPRVRDMSEDFTWTWNASNDRLVISTKLDGIPFSFELDENGIAYTRYDREYQPYNVAVSTALQNHQSEHADRLIHEYDVFLKYFDKNNKEYKRVREREREQEKLSNIR